MKIMLNNRFNVIVIRFTSTQAINSKMRAWQIYNYGDINDLRLTNSYRIPTITNPNHVLIKVDAASVNPIDLSIITGYGASLFKILGKFYNVNEFPKTLGRDFCGSVVKTGRSVNYFRPGMEVIGALWPFQEGSHSDYVVCHQNQLAMKPQSLKCSDAAAIPYAGLTAYTALVDFANIKAGTASDKRILILGGSGGVGTIALQLAKAWDAYVAVTCRDDSEDLLMELGADAIHGENLSSINETYDVILDTIGDDFERNAPYLRPGLSSRYITITQSLLKHSDQYSPCLGVPIAGMEITGKFIKNFINSKGALYQWGFFRASGSNLSVISNLVDRGMIVPVVHAQFNFENAPEAFKCLQSGGIKGKVIIQMSPDTNS